jgi:hypothetical protein
MPTVVAVNYVDIFEIVQKKNIICNQHHTPLEHAVLAYSDSSLRLTQVLFLTSSFNYFTFLAWYFVVPSAVWRLDTTKVLYVVVIT